MAPKAQDSLFSTTALMTLRSHICEIILARGYQRFLNLSERSHDTLMPDHKVTLDNEKTDLFATDTAY